MCNFEMAVAHRDGAGEHGCGPGMMQELIDIVPGERDPADALDVNLRAHTADLSNRSATCQL